ncbi:hypothetical protein FOXB_00713 [Fusarium oxysporum f. sp. conglutinans Fo5176]|uniref:Uncharacterized protein n=1 Tax=Fusarium oxysporum (strain Fo5176) TaxID=660025 RepID=F9F2T8_FUSOF|nr:hypothetical protein FOXB_00713 [Fusarium oxysporum f. sp. conglutinans Fo5176]
MNATTRYPRALCPSARFVQWNLVEDQIAIGVPAILLQVLVIFEAGRMRAQTGFPSFLITYQQSSNPSQSERFQIKRHAGSRMRLVVEAVPGSDVDQRVWMIRKAFIP